MPVGFSEWRDAVLPIMPGASETAAKSAFLFAAKTFYRRTRAWRVDTGFIPLAADQQVVVAPSAATYKPVMVEIAEFDEAPLRLLHRPRFLDSEARGKPFGVWFSDPLTVNLWPAADVAYPASLRLLLSVYPTDADALPDFALTHHFEGLEAGTLARMYAQPKAPYSDLRLAEYQNQRFNAEVQRAKARVSYGNAGLASVWSYGVVPLR